MLSKGKIQADLNEIASLLDFLKLLQERNYHPNNDSTQLNKVKNLEYVELWKYCLSKKSYSFQLSDSSLISFYFVDNTSFAFHYIRCPFNIKTSDEFAQEYEEAESNTTFIDMDYQNYVDTQPLIQFPTMLRYEYDEKGYKEFNHPVSHIHIGYNNSSRYGFEVVMDPYSFLLLILRQYYPVRYIKLVSEPK